MHKLSGTNPMVNTNNTAQTNIALPYPKKAKTQVLNRRNTKLKINKPISNNLSQLVNNFLIHQQIPQTPNNLKHLFIENNQEIISGISIGSKLVAIIFFSYPGFNPNIPGSRTETRKITEEIITNNPSYLCAFDFRTCQVLDVVQIPGEIKYVNTYRQFAAIAYSNKFGDEQNYLLNFAVSPISHKFTQIHLPIDIGVNKIHSIKMNYINLDKHSDDNTIPNGRLIIYCCSSQKNHNDRLITFNHITDTNIWELHKTALFQGVSVDITKYTQTDYFAGKFEYPEMSYDTNQKPGANRIIALHMDNPTIYYPVSEIYKQPPLADTLCTNDYFLHPDGRLELINFDVGRTPLKSQPNAYMRYRQLESIISQFRYSPNKGGIEIIYFTKLETPQAITQELTFGEYNFTVKNGIQEYQLQPGNIMKYACMKYIHQENPLNLFISRKDLTKLNIKYFKFLYSPDGKYLAQIIECSGYNNYGKMRGILVYTKTYPKTTKYIGGINPGIWRECMYIDSQGKPLTLNFIPEIKSNDQQVVDYNLMITTGNNYDSYKDYTVIPTPNVLAEKYYHMLSKTNIQLGYNNIRNISQFMAAAKLRYVDLNESCSSNNNPNHIIRVGCKSILRKMDI